MTPQSRLFGPFGAYFGLFLALFEAQKSTQTGSLGPHTALNYRKNTFLEARNTKNMIPGHFPQSQKMTLKVDFLALLGPILALFSPF